MAFSAEDTVAAVLDPTWQLLLTIFGAALVTAGATFTLSWWQSHRDHKRWVRDRRFDAYLRVLHQLEDMKRLMEEMLEFRAQLAGLDEAIGDAPPTDQQAKRRVGIVARLERGRERLDELWTTKIEASTHLSLVGPLSVVQLYPRAVQAIIAMDTEEKPSSQIVEAMVALQVEMHRALSIKV